MAFRGILTVECENQMKTHKLASSRWADC